MPRGAERIDRGEESKVDRLIRRVYEETRAKLLAELEPVEGDFRKILVTLQKTRNFIELLIGIKIGDHPVCGVNDPREFFAEAVKARSSEIRELVGGERLVALLAQYDQIAAVVVPLRAAVDDINGLLGKEPSESAVPSGRGRGGVESGDRVEKSILALIATRGSIRVSDGCAKKLGCDRTVLDRAIVGLLAEVKIKEIGGNDQSGRRYGFARSEGGRGGNGLADKSSDGMSKYERRRAQIRDAIFLRLRTSDEFVHSERFRSEIHCDNTTSRAVLKSIIKDGFLVRQGKGPATKYIITPKGRAKIRGGGGANGAGKTEKVDGRAARYEGLRSGIRDAIFERLRTSDTFVNSEDFCREAKCIPGTSSQVLKGLVVDGILTRQGSGRATQYVITKKGRTEIRGGGAGRGALRA